jgi:hypothetical protein
LKIGRLKIGSNRRMTKNALIVVVLLAACTQEPTQTALSDLSSSYGATHVEVVAKSQLNIVLHVDAAPGECPTLREETSATFDGAVMNVSRGGYDLDSTGCYPISFFISPLPMDQIHTFERTTSGSQLEVKDKSATWGINTGALFGENFLNDTANARIVWEDVTTISTATTDPVVPLQLEGNIIHYPKGTQINWVSAWAHSTPTKCLGPGLCTVDLQGDRALAPINP